MSQFERSIVVIEWQDWNMKHMSVTLEVFQFDTLSEVRHEQLLNIICMLVTLPVSQFEMLSEVRRIQMLNILVILVTLLVFTLSKSMLVQLLKPLNSCEQSPVKLTWLVAVTLVTASAGTSLPHLLSLLNSPHRSASSPVSLL